MNHPPPIHPRHGCIYLALAAHGICWSISIPSRPLSTWEYDNIYPRVPPCPHAPITACPSFAQAVCRLGSLDILKYHLLALRHCCFLSPFSSFLLPLIAPFSRSWAVTTSHQSIIATELCDLAGSQLELPSNLNNIVSRGGEFLDPFIPTAVDLVSSSVFIAY
jgi:hypothetical protein